MKTFRSFVQQAGLILLAVLVLLLLAFCMFIPMQATHVVSAVTVNGATTYQTIDGFGFSDAFGPAQTLETLASSGEQKQILDLLFSPTTGAGMTILRNLLPSDVSHTIEPNSPGSPTATPTYTWDHDSWGQVWLAQQAQSYGVTKFYGDAWSAPGFMKTNGNEANGGTLCGSPGAPACKTGDWRQAYANYLLQYYKDYLSEGITLTQLGAFNEPNLTTTNSSMTMNPTQVASFLDVLEPTLNTAGVSAPIVCCDVGGWDTTQSYASGISSDAMASASLDVYSSHASSGPPKLAVTGLGSKHVWETEWSKFDTQDATWDDGSDGSGFYWAQQLYTGMASANLSAFLYWWGVSFNGQNNGFLVNDTHGTVVAAKRLWSFANYSRYIHPGAVRIGASGSDSNLQTTAYKNTDGTLAIVALNTSHNEVPASFALQNVSLPSGTVAIPYVTDATNSTAAQNAVAIQNGTFSATIGPRQLVTYRIAAGTGTAPIATATATSTPTAGATSVPTATAGTTATSTPTAGATVGGTVTVEGTATSTPTAGATATSTPTAGATSTPTATATSTPTPSPTPSPTTSISCSVHYDITNQWQNSFRQAFVIVNTGTTVINGWELQFSFANGQVITQLWNGNETQTGSLVTVSNLSYNAAISPGQAVVAEPGFISSSGRINKPPTAFKLNGVACSIV